ncbi:hypothetical protein CRE_06010 [Caenorhabditis remanei]|uniref:Uncharacterized protein n=1 Tax=Caenorhabditis remanei TaxID=31234 RepID=E3N6G6_CAERE|nr:hypothetical protein CRE_06010 [Caenorhabditis remanei]
MSFSRNHRLPKVLSHQLKMPICSCTIRCDCIISSLTEETLHAAPDYLKKDAIRWNSAAHLYDELRIGHALFGNRFHDIEKRDRREKCRSQYHSPEHSPKLHRRRLSHSHLFFGGNDQARRA